MNNFVFRKTKINDKNAVMKIYNDARVFMAENGNPHQWDNGYPQESLISDDIEKGKSYICELNGKIAAVFMFAVEDDINYRKIYDGSWKNNESYGVIHRIAVSKDMHGKGTAKACFDFCKKECVKKGIKNMRIDTYKDNVPMQKTLMKYGFAQCGTVYIEGRLKRMAYHYVIKNNSGI